jgi:TonB family protein
VKAVPASTGALLAGSLLIATPVLAQSVSIQEKEEPTAPPVPAPPPPKPAPAPEPVTMPKVVSAEVKYPEGAEGEHEVVLELTVLADGSVGEVQAVSGDPPFAERAVEAARHFRFEPGRRGDKPIAAKIRFLVRFAPPEEEPAPEEPAPSSEAGEPKPPAAARPDEPYEILVIGERAPSRHRLGRAEIKEMPGAFGDPFRAIEVLPGVVPIVSGLPYFYVRGAPPGNVGYFFDGIPVPLLYHFAAGPGVLHPEFVEHVDLYPGAYPARYGRFAGAIVAGEMAKPERRLRGSGEIRLIDSGAMMEVPFNDGRTSAMVGGRFSYTGAVLSLIVPEVTLNYWDYQGRVRHALDGNDDVEVFFFGSGDFLSETRKEFELRDDGSFRETEKEETLVDVQFHRLDLRWDHALPRGNVRNALMLGLDRTFFSNGELVLTNRMIGARSEYRKLPRPGLELRAGADVLYERLEQKFTERQDDFDRGGVPDPGPVPPGVEMPPEPVQPPVSEPDPSEPTAEDFGFTPRRNDFTAGLWGELVVDAAQGIQVTPGLRFDLYTSGGQAALGVDPRINARYELGPKVAVTHGLALVHQAPSFVVPVPGLKPSLKGGLQRALQHSAGVSYKLPGGLESSATVFQNAFFNMTDLISLILLADTVGNEITDLRSTGHAYGFELMLRRSLAHHLGGFVSYTLSRSVRSSGRLEGPATTDRTHVVNTALSLDLGKNWRLGSRLLVYSGIPAQVAYLEAAQAPPRTPPFWRVDVKLQKRWMIAPPHAYWGLAIEVLNTTLNKEALNGSCNAFSCKFEEVGPVTIPSIGVEGAF